MTGPSYLEQFEAFTANGGGQPEWLMPIRQTAMDQFRAVGFPTSKSEDWKFTNVSPITQATFKTLAPPAQRPTLADLEPFLMGHPDWPRIVFVNGRYDAELSTTLALPAGVRLESLAEAWASDHELVLSHLSQSASVKGSGFTALNTAFMTDGLLLSMAAETVVEQPIHLLYLTDARARAGVSYPRTLIVLDHHAQGTIIESYASLGETSYFTNAVTEVSLGEGARLEHYKIQRESELAYHVGTLEARQGRASHFESMSFAFGGALARTNIYTVLAGEGSHATMNGLYVAHKTQHLDHQTRIEHAEPNCTSHEVYKGVLDDESRGVFNGKVYVHPVAQGTDGKQTNQNLLLSPRAKVDTKPQLEIFADDVRCTHGATVGQLDQQALFYCRTRGMPVSEARTLLTYGFAAEVLEELPSKEIADYLERVVMERFLGRAES